VKVGLDFFDASINRTAAWIVGTRNMQKALLIALLEPIVSMQEYQNAGNFTDLLCMHESIKTLDWGAVWNEFLKREQVLDDFSILEAVHTYEKEILDKRV